MDWLPDLSWVPNGAVVFISSTGAAGSKEGTPLRPPSSPKSASAEGATPSISSSSKVAGDDGMPSLAGNGDGAEETERGNAEEDDEALALAALGRIREAYKTRARERQSEAGRREGKVSDDEMGKRMIERKRGVENTPVFQQASGEVLWAAWLGTLCLGISVSPLWLLPGCGVSAPKLVGKVACRLYDAFCFFACC